MTPALIAASPVADVLTQIETKQTLYSLIDEKWKQTNHPMQSSLFLDETSYTALTTPPSSTPISLINEILRQLFESKHIFLPQSYITMKFCTTVRAKQAVIIHHPASEKVKRHPQCWLFQWYPGIIIRLRRQKHEKPIFESKKNRPSETRKNSLQTSIRIYQYRSP